MTPKDSNFSATKFKDNAVGKMLGEDFKSLQVKMINEHKENTDRQIDSFWDHKGKVSNIEKSHQQNG